MALVLVLLCCAIMLALVTVVNTSGIVAQFNFPSSFIAPKTVVADGDYIFSVGNESVLYVSLLLLAFSQFLTLIQGV